jgi:hypothetical protein
LTPFAQNPQSFSSGGNPGTFQFANPIAAARSISLRDPGCAAVGSVPGVTDTNTQACYLNFPAFDNRNIFAARPSTNGAAITQGRHIDAYVTQDLTYVAQLPQQLTFSASIINFTDEDPSFSRNELSYDPTTGLPARARPRGRDS